ncbi:tRNA dihydrouridine(20/20a) synthase DusA [Synechococcus elongatus]|uniref:tRNA-dihydrouridine(20/20a) synthase n=2 Tax=Synechococcus elongatus TaxID=32046 RepID=Q31LH3_SYNE7|nr:tRNA dihydrouridine(20/20a) synthase DusA [Synechococcus elongatus]ABB58096.1 TIM-barrel protein, yjbN family [Synechococcus elongatus PCC 7942 = FACHB-805]AJD57428.1 tRNA-dihydrouridine synthase [Synechococcus elongatus UTEX 2973]MBD2586815.1 tRNA dihydrouridine(20/20a) synthase DusA [Synechococcus elongatus FACHB-242]MBD2687886.1 tRNA dihydrouridine(20/20a) synthase DusA [Synechococcus elongatus FACHB-1061]MBD2706403.1 tRNA dihydrouridine(20/20a) synthase DusA [Synechococcus elongatus PCC
MLTVPELLDRTAVVRSHRLSVAPMLDRTDRHCRYFLRQISRRTLLYTEMIVAQAIQYGDRARLLDYDPQEHPVALQVGGDNPQWLADCARIAEDWGYDEINLNVGCPSDRVQKGQFGACLMARPEQVAQCVEAMRSASTLPVTVKHRIGIDDRDSYEELQDFVRIVAESGCDRFSVHARKAWLQGLDPKQNRTIPPLRYDVVYQLKQDFPQLVIEINGGILDLDQAQQHLQQVDAVMMGRAIYDNPYLLAAADAQLYGDHLEPRSRLQVVLAMMPYIEQQLSQGVRLHSITRHLLQLFHGCPGSRAWKRVLTEQGCKPGAGPEVLLAALEQVSESPILIPVRS